MITPSKKNVMHIVCNTQERTTFWKMESSRLINSMQDLGFSVFFLPFPPLKDLVNFFFHPSFFQDLVCLFIHPLFSHIVSKANNPSSVASKPSAETRKIWREAPIFRWLFLKSSRPPSSQSLWMWHKDLTAQKNWWWSKISCLLRMFLAAMSSSRSDNFTQSVCLSVTFFLLWSIH